MDAMILCYCGKKNYLTEEDLQQLCEFECDCGITIQLPEDANDLEVFNEETKKEIDASRAPVTVRVMAIQETGEEVCLRNDVDISDEELIEFLLEGYQRKYPEWKIFTENEENINFFYRGENY